MLLITPPLAPATRLPHLLAVALDAAATAWQQVRRFVDGWLRRHEAAMLARADDHLLADLGLSRGDVNDAFSGPPWEDPTVLLRTRALERRLGRHRVAHGLQAPRTAMSKPDGECRPPGRPI